MKLITLYPLPLIFFTITLPFFLSVLCSILILKFGSKIALIDIPNKRSSHSLTTPRGGGIGTLIAFVLIGILVANEILFTLIAGTMGLLGLFEDRFTLAPKLRLLIQLVISASVVWLFLGLPTSKVASALFLFWIIFIIGTANFYNFMDGINGIAGLTGIVGFGLMAFFSHFVANKPDVALLSVVLSAGCLGFLPFNFPKAKVFMGDVGSIFLGFVFASFVLRLSITIGIFLCLVMFLCTFYADAIVTIFYRWRRGENLIKAHRGHLYQYMSNELGMPHWIVSLLYALSQFVFGFLALLAYRKGLVWQFIVFVGFAIMFLFTYKVVKNIKPKYLLDKK